MVQRACYADIEASGTEMPPIGTSVPPPLWVGIVWRSVGFWRAGLQNLEWSHERFDLIDVTPRTGRLGTERRVFRDAVGKNLRRACFAAALRREPPVDAVSRRRPPAQTRLVLCGTV